MFGPSQADQPVAPASSGIGGMTTPDQNAQALKKMFAPQIPATPPTQSFPVPQAGYKRGGEVIDGVAHFQEGGESVAPVPDRIAERLAQEESRPMVDPMGNVTGGAPGPGLPPRSGSSVIIPTNLAYPGRGDPNYDEPPANVPDFRPGRAASAAAKLPAEETELRLESIRARREQAEARFASRKEESIKQREENKWMGILAAGLGMMAGKDRNALANIGAGGQQGLATFAGLEKGRREEESTARREDLMREQMGQQLDIAKMQLAKDPDMVRTYAALGGWKAGDPPEKYQAAVEEGYARAHAAERIKALQSFLEKQQLNPTANPQEIQRANAELLRLGMGSSTGSQFKLLGVKP